MRQKARETIRQSNQFLGVDFIGDFGRLAQYVADAVVNAAQSGGVYISKPRGLHWCGLAREHHQTILIGVAGQVNQNVNLILLNFPRRVVLGNVRNHAPIGHQCLHARRDCITSRLI